MDSSTIRGEERMKKLVIDTDDMEMLDYLEPLIVAKGYEINVGYRPLEGKEGRSWRYYEKK